MPVLKMKTIVRQRGVTLLEVMIAVLVLGIGLLGVAGVQTASLRNVQSSYERSQAVILMDMLAETLRADARNARLGNYSVTCDSEALQDWTAMVRNALNNSEACVDIGWDAAQSVYTLTLSWSDDRIAIGGDSSLSLQVAP
tara:strand:+ start:3696 stop:4118 length:423 start_codon:yes stop_codon:yes gene_type:complete